MQIEEERFVEDTRGEDFAVKICLGGGDALREQRS
jgi:hypothetical protein